MLIQIAETHERPDHHATFKASAAITDERFDRGGQGFLGSRNATFRPDFFRGFHIVLDEVRSRPQLTRCLQGPWDGFAFAPDGWKGMLGNRREEFRKKQAPPILGRRSDESGPAFQKRGMKRGVIPRAENPSPVDQGTRWSFPKEPQSGGRVAAFQRSDIDDAPGDAE
ncbi:MAG: hypothetical protein QM796_21095 [Chthoniobacteraceae bacterium]